MGGMPKWQPHDAEAVEATGGMDQALHEVATRWSSASIQGLSRARGQLQGVKYSPQSMALMQTIDQLEAQARSITKDASKNPMAGLSKWTKTLEGLPLPQKAAVARGVAPEDVEEERFIEQEAAVAADYIQDRIQKRHGPASDKRSSKSGPKLNLMQ